MNPEVLAGLTALGLGVLTSVHPCLLVLNLAAISSICGPTFGIGETLRNGIAYLLGRTLAYVTLGCLIAYSVLAIPDVAESLQRLADRYLGPLLILVGMFVSGLLNIPGVSNSPRNRGTRTRGLRLKDQFLLGLLHAVSFCPSSAGLFFGVLIPLAVAQGSGLLLPALYGIGTGVPLLLAVILAMGGLQFVARGSARREAIRRWLPIVAGAVLILLGIYFTLSRLFGVI